MCGSSLFRQQAKPPKTSSVSTKHHFSSGCLTQPEALLFVCYCISVWFLTEEVCVVRLCQPSICSQTAHSAPLTDSDGGRRAGGTESRPVTHCPTLTESIDPVWMDGWRQRHTQHTHTHQRRFRAVLATNWANLESTQAQLKTSQLTESNSLISCFRCFSVVSEVCLKAYESLYTLRDRDDLKSTSSSSFCVSVCLWPEYMCRKLNLVHLGQS